MDPPARDLTVAMPTADDDPAVLTAAIDAALAQPLANPLLIVDMSRGRDVRAVASARGESVRYVSFAESSGCSESRNRILELAGTRYVLFMDADALPIPGWAHAIRRAFDAGDDVAVVGARCVPIWPGRQPLLFGTSAAGDLLSLFDLGDLPLDVPRVMGTSFAVDRERTGDARFSLDLGFRPGGGMAGEEVAFCETIHVRGGRVRYEPRAVVGHQIGVRRARWRWMWSRAFRAGRESVIWGDRLDPLPRSTAIADYTFLVLIAPAYLTGRLTARPASSA